MIDCNNVLVLAYIGDAVYEVYIRNYLIKKNIVKVDKLQKEAVKYVSAKSQRVFVKLIEAQGDSGKNFLPRCNHFVISFIVCSLESRRECMFLEEK